MSYLTDRENQVISLLGSGKIHMEIPGIMGISRDNLYTLCANIRRKTGVHTRNKAQLMHFIRYGGMTIREKPVLKLTTRQKTILRLFADGYTYAQIGNRMGIGAQTATNIVCKLCKRACICSVRQEKRDEIRAYLEKISPSQVVAPEDDPAFR